MDRHVIQITGKHKKGRKAALAQKICSLLKLSLFVLCIGGFSYQILEFMAYFYTYPTVVGIEIRQPDHFVEPAVTVCNLNPVRRSDFCQKYPDKCEYVEDIKSFCGDHPHYCTEEDMSDFMITKKPDLDFSEDEKTRRIVDEFIDPWISRFIWPDEVLDDSKEYQGPFFFDSSLPCYVQRTKAFTDEKPFQGTFLKHLRKSRMGRSTYVGHSWINVDESEIYDHLAKPGVLLSIHSPFVVVDPVFDGIILEPGKKYKVHIRLEENRLLPLPYKTNCRDYEGEWDKNGGTGPRSQQVCVNSCWNVYNLACFNCTKSLMKSKLEATCIADVEAYCVKEIEGAKLKKCLSDCKVECLERKYIYRVQELPYEKKTRNWRKGRLIDLEIVIDDPEILVFEHKPQYLDIELFSYIGGFLGCWLGFSIWSSSSSVLNIPKDIKIYLKKFTRKRKNCHNTQQNLY